MTEEQAIDAAEVPDDTLSADTEKPQEGSTGDVGLEEIDRKDAWDPDRALAKIKKLNAEVRTAKERAKDVDEKFKVVDEKETRIKALEAENLRIRIGARHGLPDELIDRLRGDTEDEILADAEKLLGLVSGKRPPSQRPAENLRGGGAPQAEPEETDPRKLAARIPRR